MSSSILLFLCFSAFIAVSRSSETFDFELKPAGIEQHVEYEAYGVKCKFTYFAEGGTKEHWTVSLKRSKDHKDILCVIERPDVQSYLMFESFSVTLTNAHIKSVKIFKDHELKLGDDVHSIDATGTKVHNTKAFKNEMSKLRVRATIDTHREL